MQSQFMQRGHQGDVQLCTVSTLPTDATPIQSRPLALGERSGHQHVLTGDYQLFEFKGEVYAAIGSDGAILQHVHENNFKGKAWATKELLPIADHKPITLTPNQVVRFSIQRAYNPYSKLMEAVID